MLDSVLKALKSSDWSLAVDFLSPTFFEVIPAIGISRAMAQLSRYYIDRRLLAETKGLWSGALQEIEVQLSFAQPNAAKPTVKRLESESKLLGQTLLKLYFSSLMAPGPTFLDFRSERFTLQAEHIYWQPSPWLYKWSEDFRQALLAVYAGFYEGDSQLFRQGLTELGLLHAEDLFLQIFGAARFDALLFQLEAFKLAFHRIFISCRDHKQRLHPEFLPLGLMLFGLYEHASHLATPLLPNQAWHEVKKLRDAELWQQMESST